MHRKISVEPMDYLRRMICDKSSSATQVDYFFLDNMPEVYFCIILLLEVTCCENSIFLIGEVILYSLLTLNRDNESLSHNFVVSPCRILHINQLYIIVGYKRILVVITINYSFTRCLGVIKCV